MENTPEEENSSFGEDKDQSQNTLQRFTKSWAEESAHAPSYSGGKVTICNTGGTRNLYGFSSSDESIKLIPFLIAPCSGDLSIIDIKKGVKARTIRKGCEGGEHNSRQEEEDISNVDADDIIAYALAPNDEDLIVCSRNRILRHYDISGSPQNSYSGADGRGPCKVKKIIGRSGHDLPVTEMTFHSSGIFFATGSVDGNAKVWDLRGGYATHSFRFSTPGYSGGLNRGGLRGAVTCLTWCQDITKLWLAVGRDDGTIRIHDLRLCESDKETEVATSVELSDHVGPITCMMWARSKGGLNAFDTFFTSGRDSVISTWRMMEEDTIRIKTAKKTKIHTAEGLRTKFAYRRIHTLPVYETIQGMQQLSNIANKNDGTRNDVVFATAGSKGIIRIWKTLRKESDVIGALGEVSGLTEVFQQSQSSAFGEQRGGYTGLLLTSDHHALSIDGDENSRREELIAIDAEHNMTFFNLCFNLSLLDLKRSIIGHNDEILDLKILPERARRDGMEFGATTKKVAVATNSPQIRVFELGSYSCDVLNGHSETVLSLDVSPCGRYLATSGKDMTMRLWHLESMKCIATASGHTEAVGATALSKKIGRYEVSGKAAQNGGGAFAITASKDKTVKRWNLPGTSLNQSNQNAVALSVFCSARAHEKDINITAVAPNDSLVATGSQDKTVKLWNANDLTLIGTLKGHKRGVWDCQFSSHDRIIATGSGDKTIKIWSLSDFTCVRTFQGHSTSVLRIRFLNGGLQLVSCDAEGIIRLWGIKSNECIFSMDAHDDRIWALDLSDGILVSGGADSTLRAFRDTTQELDEQRRRDEEQTILMEQQLANHLRFKEYEHALELALTMDKPRQALKVLTAISDSDLNKDKSALSTLQAHIKKWSMSRVSQVMRYCRDWNTRARNSFITMMTVKAIVTTIPVDQLACVEGLPEIIAGIMPYAERHFDRINKLRTSSYLIDFTLLSMGCLDDKENEEYLRWEEDSKLLTKPKEVDGRVQVGGQTIAGFNNIIDSDAEILSVGESDSEGSFDSDFESS